MDGKFPVDIYFLEPSTVAANINTVKRHNGKLYIKKPVIPVKLKNQREKINFNDPVIPIEYAEIPTKKDEGTFIAFKGNRTNFRQTLNWSK